MWCLVELEGVSKDDLKECHIQENYFVMIPEDKFTFEVTKLDFKARYGWTIKAKIVLNNNMKKKASIMKIGSSYIDKYPFETEFYIKRAGSCRHPIDDDTIDNYACDDSFLLVSPK